MQSDKPFSVEMDGRVWRLVSEQQMLAEDHLNSIMFGEVRLLVLCKRHWKVALVNDHRMTFDILSRSVTGITNTDGLLRIDLSCGDTYNISLADGEAFAIDKGSRKLANL